MIDRMLAIGASEGIGAAPEGGATFAGLARMVARGIVKAHDTVVLFNTGGPLKYLDVLGG
jgi:threonine synthase